MKHTKLDLNKQEIRDHANVLQRTQSLLSMKSNINDKTYVRELLDYEYNNNTLYMHTIENKNLMKNLQIYKIRQNNNNVVQCYWNRINRIRDDKFIYLQLSLDKGLMKFNSLSYVSIQNALLAIIDLTQGIQFIFHYIHPFILASDYIFIKINNNQIKFQIWLNPNPLNNEPIQQCQSIPQNQTIANLIDIMKAKVGGQSEREYLQSFKSANSFKKLREMALEVNMANLKVNSEKIGVNYQLNAPKMHVGLQFSKNKKRKKAKRMVSINDTLDQQLKSSKMENKTSDGSAAQLISPIVLTQFDQNKKQPPIIKSQSYGFPRVDTALSLECFTPEIKANQNGTTILYGSIDAEFLRNENEIEVPESKLGDKRGQLSDGPLGKFILDHHIVTTNSHIVTDKPKMLINKLD